MMDPGVEDLLPLEFVGSSVEGLISQAGEVGALNDFLLNSSRGGGNGGGGIVGAGQGDFGALGGGGGPGRAGGALDGFMLEAAAMTSIPVVEVLEGARGELFELERMVSKTTEPEVPSQLCFKWDELLMELDAKEGEHGTADAMSQFSPQSSIGGVPSSDYGDASSGGARGRDSNSGDNCCGISSSSDIWQRPADLWHHREKICRQQFTKNGNARRRPVEDMKRDLMELKLLSDHIRRACQVSFAKRDKLMQTVPMPPTSIPEEEIFSELAASSLAPCSF